MKKVLTVSGFLFLIFSHPAVKPSQSLKEKIEEVKMATAPLRARFNALRFHLHRTVRLAAIKRTTRAPLSPLDRGRDAKRG
jgi:hypothetical protein